MIFHPYIMNFKLYYTIFYKINILFHKIKTHKSHNLKQLHPTENPHFSRNTQPNSPKPSQIIPNTKYSKQART